jgi:predicted N-acetyltransferase YhbS
VPLHEPITDTFTLRTPASAADVERVAAFNGSIHGAGLAGVTQSLVESFPNMGRDDLVYVDDSATGEVVSSLCLVPWQLAYGAATLNVGEMGIVGTDERYRNRGLVRAQVPYFRQRLAAHACTISLIQGIPFYYRQFGYTYALPLEGGVRVDPRSLPPLPAHLYTFRLATPGDLPLLAEFYNQAAQDLAIHARRNAATWRYMLDPQMQTELRAEWWLVEENSRPAGYLRLPNSHFGDELAVYEVSQLSYDAALAALHQLQGWADERGLPGVRLNLADASLLMQLARTLGGHDLGRYAWQVAILDITAFLVAIAPELERRLAAAPELANWSGNLAISLYRSAATLHIAGGRIAITPGAASGPAGLQCPPDAFTPLALGWRTLDEILRFFPDAQVEGRFRPMLEVLFPLASGYIYAAT